MKDACDELGLEQLVRSPTREGHLLDLVVTDIAGVEVQTLPAISDHKLATAELKFNASESTTIDRTVWQYQKADWERMQQILTDADWSFLQGGNPHNGAKQFHDIITQAAAECIPTKTLHERKSTHPWLTKEVEELVLAKHVAQGTNGELKAAETCSKAILKEHRAFPQKSADEMQQSNPGNKAWWSKSRK